MKINRRKILIMTFVLGLLAIGFSGCSKGDTQNDDPQVGTETIDPAAIGLVEYSFTGESGADPNAPKETNDAEGESTKVETYEIPDVTVEGVPETKVKYMYDSVLFDIDNDGKEETVIVSSGPTLGVFTLTFEAVLDDVVKYKTTFALGYRDNIGLEVKDGNIYLTSGDPDKQEMRLYIKSGKFALDGLVENEGYWGYNVESYW